MANRADKTAAPTLRTPRLVLRQLRLSDAPSLHVALSDKANMRWWSSGEHRTVAETKDYIVWNAREGEGHLCWAITQGNDEALGWVILIPKREGVQEIGYILRPDHAGRGLAREAVWAAVGYGFSTLGLRRIMADIDPENAASIRLVEALGFSLEGHLRDEWETHIGIRDSLIYAILAKEWFASPVSGAASIGGN
jgi:[ribosomal protein S5]-alanine N-acetyltransferase